MKALEDLKKTELAIRPEYLKSACTGVDIEAPSIVAWKTCAHKSETTCLAFNRDGDIVYSGGADGIVKGWSVSDGKQLC